MYMLVMPLNWFEHFIRDEHFCLRVHVCLCLRTLELVRVLRVCFSVKASKTWPGVE